MSAPRARHSGRQATPLERALPPDLHPLRVRRWRCHTTPGQRGREWDSSFAGRGGSRPQTKGLPELKRPGSCHEVRDAGAAVVSCRQKGLSTDQVLTSYTGRSGVPLRLGGPLLAAFALRSSGQIRPVILEQPLTKGAPGVGSTAAGSVPGAGQRHRPYLTLDTRAPVARVRLAIKCIHRRLP